MRKYKKETLRHYSIPPDRGCEVAPKCLECPLPQCKHDDPLGYVRQLRLDKDARMLEEIEQRGLSVDEAAQAFRITPRGLSSGLRPGG